MHELLQLPCLAMVAAWLTRPQTALSQSPAGNSSVKCMMVDLHLPPTPMLSHRESAALPGSPPWQRQHQQQRGSSAAAPLVTAGRPFGLDRSALHSPPRIVVELPEAPAATNNSLSSPSPPRTPSYILAARRGIHRRQSPPGCFENQNEGTGPSTLLDDRFKTLQPSQQKKDRGEASLSPVVTSYVPAASTSTGANAAVDEHCVADNESSRYAKENGDRMSFSIQVLLS